MLTQKRLKELLHYNPITGEFTWINSQSHSVKNGRTAGCKQSEGYLQICVDRTTYLAHRLVWLYEFGVWPTLEIDHKDRNRTNNSFSNLRPATSSQNKANSAMHKDNASGYKGVHRSKKTGKWISSICVMGVRMNLGEYLDPYTAHVEYNKASRKHFGEFSIAV